MEIKKRITGLVLALLFVTGFAIGCNKSAAPAPESNDYATPPAGADGASTTMEKPNLVYALNISWNTLFPYNTNNSDGTMVANKLFTMLVTPGDGAPEYMAAESVECVEDGYAILVHLNPACTWSDGTPCTAEDWVWSFETVTDQEFGSFYRTSYMNIIAGTDDSGIRSDGEDFGVELIDTNTFIMRFKALESIDDFVDDARQFYCMPKHILGDTPISEIAGSDYWYHPLGNGPCVFVDEPTPGQELLLQARDDYFLGELPFNKLTMIVVDTANAANAFLNGEIDIFYPSLQDSVIDEVVGQNGVQMNVDKSTRSETGICINNETVSTNVRKAIDLLLDKEVLAQIGTNGVGRPEGDLLNGDLSWCLPYEYARDVEGAKALLKEIDYDYNTVFKLGCTENNQNVAIAIQQFLGEGGIKIELTVNDGTTVYANQRSGDIDMCIVSYNSNYSVACMAMLFKNGATMTHIKDDKWDRYLSDINASTSEEERIAFIHKYQQAMRDECPIVAMYSKPNRVVTSSRVTNVYSSTFGDFCWKWITK